MIHAKCGSTHNGRKALINHVTEFSELAVKLMPGVDPFMTCRRKGELDCCDFVTQKIKRNGERQSRPSACTGPISVEFRNAKAVRGVPDYAKRGTRNARKLKRPKS